MKKDRLLWPDLLRILSIYAVIVIHTAAPLLLEYGHGGEWWIANGYDSLARWCIPVFFMLSGAFLIERASLESAGWFYIKRSQKIIIPFLIWSAFYFAWRIYFNGEDLSWRNFVPLLLHEPVYYHLWFIYILIQLYLLAPILGVYVKGADQKNLAWFLLLWFLFGSVIPMFQSCCNFYSYFSIGESATVLNYTGFFLLGYVLRDIRLQTLQMGAFVLLFLGGFFTTVYGTYYLTINVNGNSFSSTFYDYYSVNVLAMSISIFLLLKSALRSVRSTSVIGSIAACVPGIYFVHALVIAILKRGVLGFTFSDRGFSPLGGIPLFAIVVFSLSYVFIQIIKFIPLLKYIVP